MRSRRPASASTAARLGGWLVASFCPLALGAQPSTGEGALLELIGAADIPGLSIALVADGEVVWDAALGIANRETATPVSPETVFEAASLTKPVVAYAVMKLVERGALDLDTPLWDVLPYDRLEHDTRSRRITARHVLSHQSGLPNWGEDPLEMIRGPGEGWGYSGEGFVYLQRVLERISGGSLEELLRSEVFEPLGMHGSSVVWRPEYDVSAAIGYDAEGDPVAKRWPGGSREEGNAAASLHTTAVDYGRFLAAVLEGRGLEPATVVEMLSPVSQVEGRGRSDSAVNLQWGLGWGLQNGDRSTAIWHWGDNGAFRGFVIGYPSQRSGIVYFTNSQNGLAVAEDLVSRFFRDTHHAIRWLDYPRWNDPERDGRDGRTARATK